ncbi:TetR/AcrR family transcriptional regulator [Antrihabitans stalactiti]|uniref:TetR/AcrR family transcriptional regulator n=1 Tax=Antrihabitans stalactiti TaxID=2584121 RepID=A0A848KIF7_9NOCA|nr:TetR/AcrR family transcriptional regulator [Antrihabitans stalactiti]NMN98069.1 TetR/AcrR family transcriptional regulator [Antrihabitans stalactiti]
MVNPGPGRPRLEQRRRPGTTPRAEILDAAAELFTNNGYANTSTRRVADAVGIRQASLYHHFATKDDILDALLADTVAEPLALSAELLKEAGDADARLYALASFDTAQLCSSRWNLGALYLLPELRTERFESFRVRRDELRANYASLARRVLAQGQVSVAAGVEYLPFRLVETVINMRSDDGASPEHAPRLIPEAALRVLGWSGDIAAVQTAARRLSDRTY